MDKFLQIYSKPRLNQEELESLNKLITDEQILSIIEKPTNKAKAQEQRISLVNFTKHLKKLLLLKLSQNMKKERTYSNSF